MQYQETNKHWNTFSSTIRLLLASGRNDSVVITIMATESFFRPEPYRILEGIFWFFMDIFSPEKAKYISVGISQVQIRHWQEAGIISNSTSRFSVLSKIYNPLINYDICKVFLDKADIRHRQAEKLLRIYTGRTTGYHISIFEHFYRQVENKKRGISLSH